jgi:metastasis-associated protein MTA
LKTPCGNVEAKVICAWRRRDIPAAVVQTIEKPASKKDKENMATAAASSNNGITDLTIELNSFFNTSEYEGGEIQELNDTQKYLLRHRELFYSKYTDTIPVTNIRGKCSVLLYCADVEKYQDYLAHDDTFYYHLTYDPYQRTIVADRGEIKVGMKYQAEIPPILSQAAQQAEIKKIEELKWQQNNALTEREIDQFLTIAKSVGTFARALDCNNAFKQPSLPLSAAAASRDITLFHAMNTLHEHGYNIGKAALSLVTSSGPIICKDEMEDWSAAEANLFEDALDKYGKDFSEIRKDFVIIYYFS